MNTCPHCDIRMERVKGDDGHPERPAPTAFMQCPDCGHFEEIDLEEEAGLAKDVALESQRGN